MRTKLIAIKMCIRDRLPSVVECLRRKDFGRYAAGDCNMNVCFISDNDITGGNSGSGMFNGKGELIGLAFDGNWEAMRGKSSRNTTTTYGQHKTAAMAPMPFANFFSRSQSMPCQTMHSLSLIHI